MTAGHMAFWCVAQELQEQRIRERLRQPVQTFGRVGSPQEPWHGEVKGYVHHGCRCTRCKGAAQRYERARADRIAATQHSWYARRKAAGLCRDCGAEMTEVAKAAGRPRCEECREKHNARQRGKGKAA